MSIGQADKGHIHHRLIQEGYDQRQAVLLIYAWCLLLSLGAALINQVAIEARIAIFLALLACLRFSRRAFICSSLFYGITTTQRRSKTKS